MTTHWGTFRRPTQTADGFFIWEHEASDKRRVVHVAPQSHPKSECGLCVETLGGTAPIKASMFSEPNGHFEYTNFDAQTFEEAIKQIKLNWLLSI